MAEQKMASLKGKFGFFKEGIKKRMF